MDSRADELGENLIPGEEIENPEAIRAQIEQTRAEMSVTLDAIQEKLTPEAIKEQVKESVREATAGAAEEVVHTVRAEARDMVYSAGESARGVKYTVIETIKRNPMPAALAALSLGWLMMEGKNNTPPPSRSYRDRDRDYRSRNQYDSGSYGRESYRGEYARGYEPSGRQHFEREEPGMVENLQHRAGEAAHEARHMAGEAWDRVEQIHPMDAITSNPIPAALIALGVGWLLMPSGGPSSSTSRSRDRYGYYDGEALPMYYRDEDEDGILHGVQEKAGELAHEVQEKASDLVEGAQHLAGEAMDKVSSARRQVPAMAGDVADEARQQAQYATRTVRRRVRRTGTRLEAMMLDNPLLVGALALAVGAGIGLSLPETEIEREFMGEARDNLVQKTRETVSETAQKAQSVVQEAGRAIKEEVQEHGLIDKAKDAAQRAMDTAQNVAGEAKEAAKEEARAQGLTSGPSGASSTPGTSGTTGIKGTSGNF
ncbi:MAG: DUF3618 domain-containing protein [Ardenticatenales bacterium]|nr:DUF3618 domain-containing protein [Ardenticatenales bacterium]